MVQKLGMPGIQGYLLLSVTLVSIFLGLLRPTAVFARNDHGNPAQTPAEELEELTVIADKIDSFAEQNPSQVIRMDAKEIETRNFLQVHEVLGSMPGVDVKQNSGGMGTRISIRGGGGSGSVLVLIDGRPASTLQYGGVDLSSIPLDIVKKITVFKPPVPVWLGPDSAAGVISIETKEKKIRAKQNTSGKVRLSAGSYGLSAASATGKFDFPKSQILVSGGYSRKDGHRDNSQKDQGHMSIGYDKKEKGRHLQINGKAFISDHGVSGPVYHLTPNAKQRYEKASLDLKYDGFTDSVDYTFKTWGDVKRLDETADNGLKSRLDTFTTGLGTDFFLTDATEKKEWKLGGLAEHINVDHTLTGEHVRTRVSAHSEANIRWSPLVYTLGARAEYTNDFYFSPGAYAGLSFSPSKDTVLKASAGYSEHVPSFDQLYQPSHGAVDQVKGNPDLNKEKIVSLTTAVEHKFPEKHTVSLSLFRTNNWDLIQYQRDSSQVSVPVNIDRAYTQGVETLFKFVLSDSISMDVSHVWQDSENTENHKKLSYAPEHTIKVIVKTKFKTGTRLEWTTRGYTEQYSDVLNTEEEKLNKYLTTDVKVTHPVLLFEKKALVFANIHNLFDKSYSSHFGYPDDGIGFECGFSLDF